MNRAEKAVILAAGRGERLRPLTDNTPKPLIEVNGISMIDTIVSALHENGIWEIYVVTGYKAEQFEIWKKKYEDIRLIYNPEYQKSNNISSLFVAREYLDNSIILDGDQVIMKSTALKPTFGCSGYGCVWCEKETKEWLITVKGRTIEKCRIGGNWGWRLFSISRWNMADGRMLKKHVEIEYGEKHNNGIYWDEIPLFLYPDSYRLEIEAMSADDVIEIDTLSELAAVDSSYQKYLLG